MLSQFTTTDGSIVTMWPDKKVWFVTHGNVKLKFFSFTSFMKYMTKEKPRLHTELGRKF